MNFNIPKHFHVGGQDMEVKIVDKVPDDSGWSGSCCICEGVIYIANKPKGIEQSDSSKLNTFFHELTHAVLSTMNHELNDNEQFVSIFASFLTEAIKSMEE